MKLKISSFISIAFSVLVLVIFVQQPAMAYVGPGTGIAAIGALLAIIVGVVAALFGFLWYPLKRLLKQRKQTATENEMQDREEEKV